MLGSMNDKKTWLGPGAADPGISISGSSTIWKGRWLALVGTPFTDRSGRNGEWFHVERVTGRDAVAVIARTRETRSLVIIRQFRIPLGAWVWEFPAGLCDEGEAPETTAVRELAEETGYAGTVTAMSDSAISSPGLSTEGITLVRMECGEIPGEHARESSEAIEVHLLAPGDEQEFLATIRTRGEKADAKLASYLLSISWCGKE